MSRLVKSVGPGRSVEIAGDSPGRPAMIFRDPRGFGATEERGSFLWIGRFFMAGGRQLFELCVNGPLQWPFTVVLLK